ncbi:NmrA/HSCARG family protein [Nocardia arthritidis]|uniref:NAD(P)H-binding protein n=1 Tax=Nocardia arthritidis TaxID=228602 RepID=A0A6G9YN45_9NOCA|nr:NmrA/HSCARG family protein [Nocardia arthritidis]QIS14618.1 NAD(P)H-binding protein [Nocardia arthritidis]
MSTQQSPILITGATGKQGNATARKLRADGVPVRALVRDPDAPSARELAGLGAELVVGDFDAPDTLTPAVAGTRAVFLVPPAAFGPSGWDSELEAARGIAMVDAAVRAGVEQIVFTGIAQLRDDSWGTYGKDKIENAVAASGLRYTLLRPVRFMENYLNAATLTLDGIRADGVHRHLFPADQPLQMIAVADIAELAALIFADPARFHGRTLELAGDAPTPVAAAELITAATGHKITYQEITAAEADAIGKQIGNTWRLTHEHGGWQADIQALREILPGLQSLESWLAATGTARIKALLDEQRPAAG